MAGGVTKIEPANTRFHQSCSPCATSFLLGTCCLFHGYNRRLDSNGCSSFHSDRVRSFDPRQPVDLWGLRDYPRGFPVVNGRAGDTYGQKKIFVGGLIIFTIASFTGGIASSLLSLVVSRSIQGIGA